MADYQATIRWQRQADEPSAITVTAAPTSGRSTVAWWCRRRRRRTSCRCRMPWRRTWTRRRRSWRRCRVATCCCSWASPPSAATWWTAIPIRPWDHGEERARQAGDHPRGTAPGRPLLRRAPAKPRVDREDAPPGPRRVLYRQFRENGGGHGTAGAMTSPIWL